MWRLHPGDHREADPQEDLSHLLAGIECAIAETGRNIAADTSADQVTASLQHLVRNASAEEQAGGVAGCVFSRAEAQPCALVNLLPGAHPRLPHPSPPEFRHKRPGGGHTARHGSKRFTK